MRADSGGWVLLRASLAVLLWGPGLLSAQELGGAGTVQGTVKDPTGGVMAAVTVDISNPVSGFNADTTTDAAGKFVFSNLPPNPYHVAVDGAGIPDARTRT